MPVCQCAGVRVCGCAGVRGYLTRRREERRYSEWLMANSPGRIAKGVWLMAFDSSCPSCKSCPRTCPRTRMPPTVLTLATAPASAQRRPVWAPAACLPMPPIYSCSAVW